MLGGVLETMGPRWNLLGSPLGSLWGSFEKLGLGLGAPIHAGFYKLGLPFCGLCIVR